MNNLVFSEATEKDLVALTQLINSAYRGDSSRKGWTTEADLLEGQRTDSESLRENLRDKANRKILCLREDGKNLLGCVYLERFKDDRGVGCYLGMLTVSPTRQTSGIGKMLMQKAEEVACQWGATRMTLGVIQLRSELMAWYERRGYSRTGETQPFPYGDPKAGIALRQDLHFVMFEKKL